MGNKKNNFPWYHTVKVNPLSGSTSKPSCFQYQTQCTGLMVFPFNLRLWKGEHLEDLHGGNVKQGFVDPYAPSSQDQSQRKPPTIKVSGESAADLSSCVLTVSMKLIGNTFELETLVRIKVSASQDPKKMLNDESRLASSKDIAPKKPFLMEALWLHWTTYF